MKGIIKGKVLKYGDNINTDIISPPQYMELSIEEASKYSMINVEPNFSNKVNRGDIMVAGSNFGSGSSRETSPLTLKYLGISAIAAKSFARIFYRNSINIGVPVVECADTDKIRDMDIITIDLEHGIIKNETTHEEYSCSKIPNHLLPIIENGGLFEYLKKSMREIKNG